MYITQLNIVALRHAESKKAYWIVRLRADKMATIKEMTFVEYRFDSESL